MDRREQIRTIADKIAGSEGLELVDVEYRREGPRQVLRLFIDKPGGVNLEDCQEVSGQVGAQIEVEELVPGSYTLEVSSPGLDRRLTSAADFVRFAGRMARVTTLQPIHGQRRFRGRLEGFSDGEILLRVEQTGLLRIPLEQLAKARLEVEI